MEHFSAFFPAICAALGLFLAGAANLVFLRKSLALRAGATSCALGVALALAAQLEPARTLTRTAELLALAMIPFVLLSSGRVTRAAGLAIHAAGRPVVRSALLTLGGIGLAIGSVVVFERADNKVLDETQAELEFFHAKVPMIPAAHDMAVTDRGTPIPLMEASEPRSAENINEVEARLFALGSYQKRVIREGPADDRSNCHGWVFTGGRYQLRGMDVEVILRENGYKKQAQPRPGDLIVYRSVGDVITHTGVVQYTAKDQPVLVRGKWGNLGVFTHVTDQCPYSGEVNYYRSPRAGHLLTITPKITPKSLAPSTETASALRTE